MGGENVVVKVMSICDVVCVHVVCVYVGDPVCDLYNKVCRY